MLQRCKDKNIALNREKCHFIMTEGIVLGHKISTVLLEVDHAKISLINPDSTNYSEGNHEISLACRIL